MSKACPPPRSVGDIRSIVGLTGYYRGFIPKYADMMAPVSDLLKKGKIFKWEEPQQEAFNQVKMYLIHYPTMAFPDQQQVQVLTTDASHLGLGAVLSQHPPGEPDKEKVISYDSRILRGPETRYSAVHQEALGTLPIPRLENTHFTSDRTMAGATVYPISFPLTIAG